MNVHAEAIEKHVVVINQLHTKTSFALDPETGEQVFISARLAKMFNIEVDDHLKVFVSPNRVPENTTQWYALYVKREAPPEPQPLAGPFGAGIEPAPETQLELDLEPEPDGEQTSRQRFGTQILEYLKDGIDSAKNVAAHVGTDTTTATHALISLHNDGLVARASIKKSGYQSRDSFVLWALRATDFIPEEDQS